MVMTALICRPAEREGETIWRGNEVKKERSKKVNMERKGEKVGKNRVKEENYEAKETKNKEENECKEDRNVQGKDQERKGNKGGNEG
jgi:hypothetical protein